MKYLNIFFYIFLLLLSTICSAQRWEQLESEYNSYIKANENKLAIDKAKEMFALIGKIEGDTSIRLAISKKLIGNAYGSVNVDSALFYYNQGLEILKYQKRSRHIQAAKILYNEANIFYVKHDYEKYVELLNYAAEINRELEYPEFPFAEWPIKKLYFYNVTIKNINQYERLLLERIGIFKKFNQANTVEYGFVCRSLGSYYITHALLEDGERYISESTQAFINSIGENNFNCATNYFWLAGLYNSQQNYIKAEYFFKKSIEILEDTLSKSFSPEISLFYYSCIDEISQFYWGLGHYYFAQEYEKICRNHYLDINDTLASNLSTTSLAVSYIDDKKFDTALAVLLSQKKYNIISKTNIKSYLSVLKTLVIAPSIEKTGVRLAGKKVLEKIMKRY